MTVNLEAGGATDAAAFARIPSGNGQALTYAPLPNDQIPPNEVALVFLWPGGPGGVAPPSTTAAFHITTSAPVVAYDIDPYGGGPSAVTSATLLIPTSAWGTNYIAVAPWPFGTNSQNPRLTLTAAEDATDVTISPVVDMLGGTLDGAAVPGTAAGVPVTYSMNKGQTLRFEQEAELTGSAIESTKPIGMVGSSGCINIDACCCDGAHQQIPPIKALGNEYVGVRYRNRVDGMEESPPWRVVGVVDGTTLTYEPATPAGAPTTLSLGQVIEFRSSGPFVIRSQDEDHPFYLAAYMTGGGDFGDAGDPEFVNVIPALQYLPNYVFFADPTYPETNLVVVRRKAGDGMFKDVTLDCAGVLTGWQPIGATDYELTRFDLVRFDFAPQGNCDNGRREMKSDAPFGLTVWGWGTSAAQFTSTYVSYAYPAGAGVQPINQVVVPPVPK
ncbi:MAG: IgGFc-binding protein [Polyangiaceae bacterium]